MKNKKRIRGIAAAAALSLTMTATVYAGDAAVENNGGQASFDVTGSYEEGTDGGTVYQVDITWGAMDFTYTGASKGTWDPENHRYIDSVSAAWSWDADANRIEITNHSNTEIDAAFSYESEAGYEGIAAGFYNATTGGSLIADGSILLESAEPEAGSQSGTGKTGQAFLQITDGALTSEDDGKTLGSVTVSVRDGALLP